MRGSNGAAAGAVEPERRPNAAVSRPVGMDALVMRGDRCESCERWYFDGNCKCPDDTKVVRLRGFHSDMVYGSLGVRCYASGFSFDFCLTRATASNTSDPRSISFFTGIAQSVNETGREAEDDDAHTGSSLIERCTQVHSATDACRCPSGMIPRPVLHPVPLGVSGMDVLLTVFCAPATTTVHIIDAETEGCYNPLGANVSCECMPGAPSIAVPMTFVNVTSLMLRPGLLRFCSALPEVKQRWPAGVVGSMIVISGLTGGSAAQLQGMESLLDVDCQLEQNSVSASLVPVRVGGSSASGLVGMTIVITCVGVLQGLAVVVMGVMLRYCFSKCSIEGTESMIGALQYAAEGLKCPAVTVLAAQVAVAGTALESLRLLLGSGQPWEQVAGSGGMLAIVGLCVLVCVFGIRCSTIVVNDMPSYAEAHSCYPPRLRRVLPSFFYESELSPWRYWSFVFSTYQHRRFFVECVDLSITAIILGVVAGVKGAMCRGMSLAAAAMFVVSGWVVFALDIQRRPLHRYFSCLTKVLNCLLAFRKGLPNVFGWVPDEVSYGVVVVIVLMISYTSIIGLFELCLWKKVIRNTTRAGGKAAASPRGSIFFLTSDPAPSSARLRSTVNCRSALPRPSFSMTQTSRGASYMIMDKADTYDVVYPVSHDASSDSAGKSGDDYMITTGTVRQVSAYLDANMHDMFIQSVSLDPRAVCSHR